MSYQPQGAPDASRRQQQPAPPFPILGTTGAATGRAPAAGVYGMPQQYGQQQQQQAEGYGGPPPSPVVATGWGDRAGYVDEGYIRQDPTILPAGAGTPIASNNSGNGDTGFMVSAGGASAMGAPVHSFYPPSLYGVPASVYPYQQPGAFPTPYGGGGGGTGGSAAATAAAAGSTAGNFYGQTAYARSTNPGQPIQTTTNLQGPDGCNLFVFHIPNTMTNDALFRLFSKFGNVISARIMVEKATGRSRGFGFVSYDNRDSAEKAISQMNGYQIEHKRLKVQHKKDKERERYVTTPSPRMMGPGVAAGRMQQAPHFRQPLLPAHGSALRHHQGGDDKLPPPSPAADTTGGSGVTPGFTVAGEEDHRQGDASTTEVGIDPGPRANTGGDKFGARPNEHPHLAYIYRGRGTATDDSGGFPSAGGVDGKVPGGDDKPPHDQDTGYRGHDESAYLTAPSSSVGGRAASPDPKGPSVSRARSSSPSVATNAVSGGALPHQSHQSLEHAMQTKLTIGGSGSPPSAAQPS